MTLKEGVINREHARPLTNQTIQRLIARAHRALLHCPWCACQSPFLSFWEPFLLAKS
jgi:hypothetical protein